MRGVRHTATQRAAIVERARSSGRPIAEIAAEEGIAAKTIYHWMCPKKREASSFIELPPPPSRTTVVELSFADGTVLRVRG